MNHLVKVVKNDGTEQLFEEDKLANSLRRVGAPEESIEQIVEEVEHRMYNGMSTNEIYSHAFELLKRKSASSAVKYSVRRALLEMGPDGFPFEKFVARVFRMWGYQTLTDQTVMGGCVPHEIDIVAWKGNDLAMAEAKFHNVMQLTSDIKVVLYVKARFDDLSEIVYDYGGAERKLTERWVITNTKFTDRAIHYANCQKLKLLGWNYPAQDNLHSVIERNSLHPITCLSTLNKSQKRELVSRNILICLDLLGSPEVLKDLGIKGPAAEKVLSEAQMVVEQAK